MDPRNLKGIIESDLDTQVYRIYSINRLVELLQNSSLTLVRPRMWDDPFENFILRCTVIDEADGKHLHLDPIANKWYGLCWTYNQETDAMWRIYGKDGNGVRIRTTIKKIADQIWDSERDDSRLRYFIGKVEYRKREVLENFMKETTLVALSSGGQSDKFAETLLMKRTAFRHEEELRVLAHDINGDDPRAKGDIYSVDVDPNDFIEEVCLDPRLSSEQAKKMENEIRKAGYKGTIIQSELYRLRITTIRLGP
ncbi:MAG: DUF2971 domain-containing protein [Syntrophobacteraceae bacterium]